MTNSDRRQFTQEKAFTQPNFTQAPTLPLPTAKPWGSPRRTIRTRTPTIHDEEPPTRGMSSCDKYSFEHSVQERYYNVPPEFDPNCSWWKLVKCWFTCGHY